ncbi:conserved Plasmodium protein, unknown function [Plasmodium ovale wallikeri]|uniref:Uncharacterized protein n=1 Tax=Plasmodium ovale wallikeri TaxID=864142 RepID=A0A1A8YRQ2_PLAOA|nr:conserved Plasmodium protein, unknown function [Plasmodium ovale wallikeri]
MNTICTTVVVAQILEFLPWLDDLFKLFYLVGAVAFLRVCVCVCTCVCVCVGVGVYSSTLCAPPCARMTPFNTRKRFPLLIPFTEQNMEEYNPGCDQKYRLFKRKNNYETKEQKVYHTNFEAYE